VAAFNTEPVEPMKTKIIIAVIGAAATILAAIISAVAYKCWKRKQDQNQNQPAQPAGNNIPAQNVDLA
jgi:Flp pilus assembly protein CpaB